MLVLVLDMGDVMCVATCGNGSGWESRRLDGSSEWEVKGDAKGDNRERELDGTNGWHEGSNRGDGGRMCTVQRLCNLILMSIIKMR